MITYSVPNNLWIYDEDLVAYLYRYATGSLIRFSTREGFEQDSQRISFYHAERAAEFSHMVVPKLEEFHSIMGHA